MVATAPFQQLFMMDTPPPPTGAGQYPALLSSYAHKPPFQVAGVDYYVGCTGAPTDWRLISGPGISIVGNLVRVDATSNVHISNIDFTQAGGANLAFISSPGGVVDNCIFKSSTVASIISADASSPGLTVTNCTIDGNGAGSGSGLISVLGGGTVVVQYNWMRNFPQHALEMSGNVALNYSYNLVESGGKEVGAHYNALQWVGANKTCSAVVSFNTVVQPAEVAGGEIFQFYIDAFGGASSTFTSVSCDSNVIVASESGAISYAIHGSSGTQFPTNIGNASITNNYVDLSGSLGTATSGSRGLYYASSPTTFTGWTASGNVHMVTGEALNTLP